VICPVFVRIRHFVGQTVLYSLWESLIHGEVGEDTGPNLPTHSDVEALHHAAHVECFIANSVRTEVETRSTWQM